jgi:hypothetical protein
MISPIEVRLERLEKAFKALQAQAHKPKAKKRA